MSQCSSCLVWCGVLVGVLDCGAVMAQGQTLPVKSVSKAPGLVHQIKVVNDQAPDASSLESIVESVTRDCKTNDEKAVAIYNVNMLFNYHRAYPEEPGLVSALKEYNVYGWSLCGGLHTAQAALWRAAGWKWRYLGWPGHTTVEAHYDGQWHYLDVFLKFYAWKPDANAPGGYTIASQADIAANPGLVFDDLVMDDNLGVMFSKLDSLQDVDGMFNWTAQPMLVCGDGAPGVVSGCKARRDAGSPTEWARIRFDDSNYSTDVNLAPGYSLKLTWDALPNAYYWVVDGKFREDAPVHGCPPRPNTIDKDYRASPSIGPILEPYVTSGGSKRSYANGVLTFAPDFSNDAFLAGLAGQQNVKVSGGQLVPAQADEPAWITIELQSPYIMTKASGHANDAKAEISLDGGATFRPIDLKEFTSAVKGVYRALVKLTFDKPITALQLEAIVQCNRCALPYLAPGRNNITVSARDGEVLGGNQLVVTYAYRTGYHEKSFEQIAASGGRVGGAQHATWSATPTVVQKVFTAKDLPTTFEIDVPTPKGKFPAYPRMLYLHREVLAAGDKPAPLPPGAVSPKMGPTDVLMGVPTPWTMGATPTTAKRSASAR